MTLPRSEKATPKIWMDELRPCPFCGEKARLEERNLGDGEVEAIVDCPECNCAIVGETALDAAGQWNSADCWQRLDAQIKGHNYTAAKESKLRSEIACAVDLANSWARELQVKECDNPYSELALRNLIDRLWAKSSERTIR